MRPSNDKEWSKKKIKTLSQKARKNFNISKHQGKWLRKRLLEFFSFSLISKFYDVIMKNNKDKDGHHWLYLEKQNIWLEYNSKKGYLIMLWAEADYWEPFISK